MKVWIWILSWLFYLPAFAQSMSEVTTDSLRAIVMEHSINSNWIEAAKVSNMIANSFRRTNLIDSAERYFEQSLKFSLQANDQSLIANNYYELGRITYQPRGLLDSASALLQKALAASQSVGDGQLAADIYFMLGAMTSKKGDLFSSLSNYQLALPLYEKNQDSTGIADVYNSMGILYSKREDFEKSLEFHGKAMEIERSLNNFQGLAINHNNQGLAYKKMGDYENSLNQYRRGLQLEKKDNFPLIRSAILNNIGNVFELRKLYDSALFYQRESLKIARSIGFNEAIGWANKGIASVYLTYGNLDQAISYGTTGYEIGVKTNTRDLSKQSSEILHKAYARKRDFQRAYLYLSLFKQHSDSLLNAETIKRTAELEYEYANEQSNRIQALELQAQEALYLSQINEQKKIRNQVVVGLILMVVVLGVMWIGYWQKRKVNKELEEKNRIISDQAMNLERLNETKDRFFSIVSHDLRGPMAIFNGFSFMVKTLLEERRYEKLEKFSDEVGKVAKQMSQLLDNLLSWALKQQGEFPYNPERLNLKECVDENLTIFNSMATSKKIELKSDVLPTSSVWADKNSLMTIIRNLISNSLKFTEPNGKIRIHCGKDEDQIAIKFSDSGVGIPTEKLDSIFNFQENKTSIGTKGEKGVGLGLKLVHDFVKLNKGEIKVESEKKQGTTFTVLLPPPIG